VFSPEAAIRRTKSIRFKRPQSFQPPELGTFTDNPTSLQETWDLVGHIKLASKKLNPLPQTAFKWLGDIRDVSLLAGYGAGL
jgi:hypothetical protein